MAMMLEQQVRILAQLPLFAQLDGEALRLLAFTAETISLAKDEPLYRAGDASDCGYVLMAGAMSMAPSMDGAVAETVTAPALLGEVALLVETLRPGNATACEPAQLIKITRPLFLRVMREFPAGAAKLRVFLGGRLTQFADELDQASRKAESRINH